MPAPLSIDLRQRIIAAYEAKEGSQRQLAKRFKVSLSFVRDLMRHYLGERLYDSEAPKDGGRNISLLGGMSINGLIATLSIVGSVNTDVLLFYIQAILIPQLWTGAIIVMDNLPVHHASVIQETIEAVVAKVVFLPPYSSDLSIKLC